MRANTRKLTLSAMLAALTLVFLYIANISPTGQAGFVAVASLFTAAAVIEAGIPSAAAVFAVSAGLGMLILPNKATALLYLLFLGYYPILKVFAEKPNNAAVRWIIKLLVFNAALTVIWLTVGNAFLAKMAFLDKAYIFFPALNIVFVIYDLGLGKLISFYINRISRYVKK